jgi:hypothetical protein
MDGNWQASQCSLRAWRWLKGAHDLEDPAGQILSLHAKRVPLILQFCFTDAEKRRRDWPCTI